MPKGFLPYLCGGLAILVLLAWRELQWMPDGRLRVHFLDVGQGDATLIVSPAGKQVLVDGGPDMKMLKQLGRFMPFFDRTIELLVLTHPNEDHLASVPEVLRRYRVKRILMSGIVFDLPRYRAFLEEAKRQRVPVVRADPGRDINLGDGVTLDILWPPLETFGTEPRNENHLSVVLRILHGEHTILLPGDIEEKAETAILATGGNVQSKVLKVPHHGSKTSSSTGFLLAVQPDLAIVSAGNRNPYGHPHQSVIDRYERLGIETRSTAEEGTISLILD